MGLVPMDEWVLYTMNVDTLDYGTETLVGEEISSGKERHQNTRCLNCDRMGQTEKGL